MPIDSVGDPFAEISSEASGLCTMKECVCLRSESVARIDFLEWTGAGISTRQELVPETVGARLRAGFFRVWFGNSKKS